MDGYLGGFTNFYTNDKNSPWPFAYFMAVVDLKTMKVVAKSGFGGGDTMLNARSAIDLCKKLR